MQEHQYLRLPETGEGLRLHLNENTGGCSPRVIEALGRVRAEQAACYPDYEAVTRACAAYFGVRPEQLVLTNGLDEGILATSLACLRSRDGMSEAIVIEPAFEMYGLCTDVAGGRVVSILPRPDFAFPIDAVLGAISSATRLVFLTNPNNPTGQCISRDAIRQIIQRVPPQAVVFVDEAYADFAPESFVDEIDRHPNVVIGRTFAKAHGLAGLRIGALIAAPAHLDPMRRIVPPYSLNVCAVAALGAALADVEHVRRYLAEVAESKQLLYATCDRLGLEYWPSAANFVLVRTGGQTARLLEGLAARRIFIRDRSDAPGCEGCVRITTGVVAHTRQLIAAMEEILCDGR